MVLCTSQETQVNKMPMDSYGTLRSQLMVTSRQRGRSLRKASRPRAYPSPPEHSTHMYTPTYTHTPVYTHPRMHTHAGLHKAFSGPGPGCTGAFCHLTLHMHPFLLGAKGQGQ